MLKELKKSSLEAGFETHIAMSDKDINDQLNRIIREGDLPLALVSWDLDVKITFDENGFLKNPTTEVTMLLLDKASSLEKIDLEEKAEEMGELFISFIRGYKDSLVSDTNVKENPITDISFVYVPKYGNGQHSGVLGKFTTQLPISDEC